MPRGRPTPRISVSDLDGALTLLTEDATWQIQSGLKLSVRNMIAAGKISSAREYLDTLHMHDVWFRE